MNSRPPQSISDTLSPDEMKEWLEDQIRDSAKAHELRIRDAKSLIGDYLDGRISPEEAMQRLIRHDIRWGDALFGTSASSGLSDDAIVAAIDAARAESRLMRSGSVRR